MELSTYVHLIYRFRLNFDQRFKLDDIIHTWCYAKQIEYWFSEVIETEPKY